jgi:hypothetical protein
MTTPATKLPPPETPKKNVDRLALIVSILALIVSGFSYWDSHKAARRDDERARPQLLPTAPHASLYGDNISPNGSIFLSVRNPGELTATITQVSVKPLTVGIEENGPERGGPLVRPIRQ